MAFSSIEQSWTNPNYFLPIIGSQSILEADGLRAVFIIERDQHSVIVEENGVHKDLNQCLALLLLRYIELSEFHQPESDEVSIKGRLS